MFILSNINFYWVLVLENGYNEKKLNSLIKKTFKIIFRLNRRFPSEILEATMMIDNYCSQLFRIASKFNERIMGHNKSMIKKLLMTNNNKAVRKLKEILEEKHESRRMNIKNKQLKNFGIETYEKIPFNNIKSFKIRKVLDYINIESRKVMEPENIEELMSDDWVYEGKAAKRLKRG